MTVSSDDTPKFMAKCIEKKVKYIRHLQNIGKSNNMRSGFEAAKGEYFLKFDDDDRILPNFLRDTVAILEENSHIDFIGTDHWVIDWDNIRKEALTEENSRRWGRTDLSQGVVDNLLEVVFVNQSFQVGATLFRRQSLADVGFMRLNWQNCEDNDLFVRLALAGKKAYYLPEKLMEYRFHAEQQGIDRAIPYLQDKLRYLESYNFESEKLDKIRLHRLAETQLLLGLRLIEKGETQKGKDLVLAGQSADKVKAWTGLGLSIVPTAWRGKAFKLVRQVKG